MTDFEFNSGNVYRIKKEHMKNIFKIYNVKNIDSLRKNIDDGHTPKINLSDEHCETNSLDVKIKKLKAAEITLRVWERLKQNGYSISQFQDFVYTGNLSLPENETFYAESSNTEAIPSQTQQIQFGNTITHKPNKILQEDGTLRCKHCNKTIEMRAFNFEQLDDYRIHVESTHGQLTELERSELLEIYPN
ncbi:MAG: hypothetical protein OEW78_06780 [Nitrosopumilus sp.]|uniref:hypothetical protein n=1 Tax=Nitrosopumilus sp. TaxID=2024843 RepID=UPI00246A8B2A|nr:hypothetical protein [Nitrosopumilus sp.]MDH5431570.1 hypothetical protein [Nitrosopumilus sp.]